MLVLKHWKKSLIIVLSVLVVGGALGELTRHGLLGAPVVGTMLHIESMGVTFKNVGGPKRLAIAQVVVADELGNRINGALVEGNWSGCFSNADSATTQTKIFPDGTVVEGWASIEANKANSCWGQPVKCTWTFTVTNISKTGYSYDPAANGNGQNSASTQCE